MQTGPRGQELFAKKATDNDQMQQKHFSIVQDEEQLWKNRVLGEQNPKSLLYTLWCLLTLHFGLRGRQEHHEMFVEDFSLNRDDQGTEQVTFEENAAKTRQGGLRKKRRAIQPKMFATGGPRCPV